MLVVDEILLVNGIGIRSTLIRELFYYGIGYSLMFMMGLRFPKLSKSQKAVIFGVASLLFIMLQLIEYNNYNGILRLNDFKYPPRMVFLLWGVCLGFISIEIVRFILPKISAHLPLYLLFIGQNTIWIYLYHIPLIQLTGMLKFHWALRYIVVYALATVIVLVQNVIVYKWNFKGSKYFIG